MTALWSQLIVTALVVSLANPVLGQPPAPPLPVPSTTGTVPPTPAPSTREWSGESGSSGHPLMTADAIRTAAANFGALPREPLAAGAAPRRFAGDPSTCTHAGLTPDLRIMDLMDAQPEFTKSIWDYLDILVNDARIQKGREMLAKHRATFDAVEKAYGVDRHFIASIWGVESNFGTLIGERSVLRSTATLACVGRRQDYFRDEFLSALEILHRGDVRPEHLKGSWAGAFGPTQFMPTSFKRYAVDFDGDGRRDVVESFPDLIASTANNLKKDGWVAGQTWGYEVIVPQGFNYLLADRSRQMTMQQWEQLGIRRAGGIGVSAPGGPRLSAGSRRRPGTGVPDAAQFPGDHEIQSGRSLCPRHRASRRPVARRRGLRARHGRGTSECFRARSAGSCRTCWCGAGSTPASRLGGSAPRPGRRCAIFRPRSASFRTVSRRKPCSPASGARDAER